MFANRVKSIVAFCASLTIIGYMGHMSNPEIVSSSVGSILNRLNVELEHEALCDPTAGNGWVSEEGHWERSDGQCQSNQFVHRFRSTPKDKYVDEFPTLINKTMFILGDSVGRHLYEQLCDEIGAPKQWRAPPNETTHVDYSEALVCIQPELNLTITQFHQYGFANATDLETVGYLKKCFPGGPYDFETRVPHVWDTLLADIPTPDYVQISGGAWDFLYMYNRDILEKRFHSSVPAADLEAFGGRLRSLLHFSADMFPTSKIVFVNVHPLNNVDLAVKHIWGGGYFQPPLDTSKDSELLPPLFSQRRLVQHAQTLRRVAEEEEVDTLDYWKLKDSFNAEEFWAPNDAVHPNTAPRVAMVEMMLEKLHRWSLYGV